MKKITALTICALAIVLLSSCAESNVSAPQDTQTPTPAQTSTPVPEESETVNPVRDNLTACKSLLGDDMGIINDTPALFTGIGSNLTTDQQIKLEAYHRRINTAKDLAENDLAGHLTSFDVPFQQFADALSNGGGSLNMNTSHVAADVTNILQDCAAAGYKMSN